MASTLNELIEAAVLGGEATEKVASASVAVQAETPTETPTTDLGEAEKIASALEFIGRRGVASFLKEAMTIETNAGTLHKAKTQSQTGPHSGAPSMSPGKASGLVENNAGSKPGSGAQNDTSSTEKGTHHPALKSSESAIAYDKKVKSQRTSPALKKVLDTAPFADGKLKENLSGAAGKGDKNIHKSAHDLAAVRQELARRAEGVE